MPQQNIDKKWEATHKVNISKWARILEDKSMSSEEKRRYIIEHHEETQAFLLDCVELNDFLELVARFKEYLDRLPSLETLARVVRKNAKKRRPNKPDSPVSMPIPYYERYMRSPHIRALKEKVLAHQGKTCCACNSPRDLVLHHRDYNSLGREDINDLSLFCVHCHNKLTNLILPNLRVPKNPPKLVKEILGL